MTVVVRGPAIEQQIGLRPQCSSAGCEYLATVAYQAHPVDRCEGRTGAPDVVLLCGQCLRDALLVVQGVLLDVFLGLRPDECEQCGLKTVTLSDIIVKLCPLWFWGEG